MATIFAVRLCHRTMAAALEVVETTKGAHHIRRRLSKNPTLIWKGMLTLSCSALSDEIVVQVALFIHDSDVL